MALLATWGLSHAETVMALADHTSHITRSLREWLLEISTQLTTNSFRVAIFGARSFDILQIGI
jgi:hypothetical protein